MSERLHHPVTREQFNPPGYHPNAGEWRLFLEPHGPDFEEWETCGTVAPPGSRCSAWSLASLRPCPKKAAVVLWTDDLTTTELCGGHLDSHRQRRLLLARQR